MPAGLMLYLLSPDWSLMYLANPDHLPLLLVLPFVIALSIAAPGAGFMAAFRLIKARNDRGLRWLLGSTFAACILTIAIGWQRLLSVAYYDDFHHGGAVIPLYRSSLVVPLLIITFFVAFAFVYSVLQVRRHVEALNTIQTPPHRPSKPAAPEPDTLDETAKK